MIARSVAGVALVLGVVGCVSGCSTTGAPLGTISGHVVNYGGPFNLKTHKGSMDGLPAVGQAVDLKSGDRVVSHNVTSASGTFTFTVRPGTYRVSSICGSAPITVAAGITTGATIRCLYP